MHNSPVASTPAPETKLCDGHTVANDATAFATREPRNITGFDETQLSKFHPGICFPTKLSCSAVNDSRRWGSPQ